MYTRNKQKEVFKFIKEENMQVCAIIETHIKAKRINDVCEKMFGSWEWTSNSHLKERKSLWKELYLHKRVCGDNTWALMGYLNVTLNIEEHSSRGSFMTDEMQEFKDCINLIEFEDIGSSGFFYTWTKSLRNPDKSVLKKLDRIMVSEAFLGKFAGIIKDALKEFNGVSVLFPNMNKSSLFFGSLHNIEKDKIMKVMKFKEGKLPTTYLGVPLITKKERNLRIFRRNKKDEGALTDAINETIKLKLISLRVKESSAVDKVANVWGNVAEKINLTTIDYNWENIIQDLVRRKNGNNIWSVMRRLSFAVVVYYIWQERNLRIFRRNKKDEGALTDAINETIKLKLISLRVKESSAVDKVANVWDLQFRNLQN
nr:hypothetical protein [Tanacetum cinerariifolium]